jgi:hypothetical protein
MAITKTGIRYGKPKYDYDKYVQHAKEGRSMQKEIKR